MTNPSRALILSYANSLYYFAGTTQEPQGLSKMVSYLRDGQGKPQKFACLDRAKQALMALGFTSGFLVMHSAYDEMIGNEPAQYAELWMPFTLEKQPTAESMGNDPRHNDPRQLPPI